MIEECLKRFKPQVYLPVPQPQITHSTTKIQDLPTEVLIHIFNMLSLQDLLSCMQVCRAWNAICKDKAIWKKHWVFLSNPVDISPYWVYRFKSRVFRYRNFFIGAAEDILCPSAYAINEEKNTIYLGHSTGKLTVMRLKYRKKKVRKIIHTDYPICNALIQHISLVGERLYIASQEKRFKIWNLKSLRLEFLPQMEASDVITISCLYGNVLFFGCGNGALYKKELQTDGTRLLDTRHTLPIESLTVQNSALIVGDRQKFTVWDVATHSIRHLLYVDLNPLKMGSSLAPLTSFFRIQLEKIEFFAFDSEKCGKISELPLAIAWSCSAFSNGFIHRTQKGITIINLQGRESLLCIQSSLPLNQNILLKVNSTILCLYLENGGRQNVATWTFDPQLLQRQIESIQ